MTRSRSTGALLACALLVAAGVAGTTVVAAQAGVQISSVTVTPNETVTGEPVTVETTIANLEGANGSVEITDVYIRTSGETEGHGRIEDVGSVPPGSSVTIPMSVTFQSAGQKRLTAHVVVRDQSGQHHSYEYPVYVEVEDPVVKAEISTSAVNNQSGTTEVVVTNFGNTDLSDVEVTATADGETVDRKFLFDVAPGSTQSTTFDTESISAETVTFTATYTAAGRNHTTTRTVDLDNLKRVRGEIRLTGVQTTRAGSTVTIEGDAANLGSTDAESVYLRFPETDGVSPVSPSGDYYVGGVEASEFATFELTGRVEDGTSAVPVEISYVVDDERVNTTQRIDLGSTDSAGGGTGEQVDRNAQNPDSEPNGQPEQRGSGGLPLMPIAAVLALAAVGFGIYRWRQ